jgi:hypothetical protein
MHLPFCRIALALLVPCATVSFECAAQSPHTLAYAPRKSITLSLPDRFDINIAATGLRRVRFFAQAPDGRIFVTDMYDLADNTRGSVFILDGWNAQTHSFTRITHYLDHLRNPNNLAFWTDPATHQSWLYLPLTDKLIRYKFNAGDNAPTSPPETLVRFPDYGLNYKYGGWHLTRTVAIAQVRGASRIFVSAGSSCNYCHEREVLRAAIVSMDPDGKHPSLVAQGMRNAVDLRSIAALDGALFATNMGDDHLGDKLPEDTFFKLDTDPPVRRITAGPPATSPTASPFTTPHRCRPSTTQARSLPLRLHPLSGKQTTLSMASKPASPQPAPISPLAADMPLSSIQTLLSAVHRLHSNPANRFPRPIPPSPRTVLR